MEPINYTIYGKRDGFGAQYLAIISGIAYCNHVKYNYIHKGFGYIAHGTNKHDANNFIGIPLNKTKVNKKQKICKLVTHSECPDMYYTKEVLNYIESNYYCNQKPTIPLIEIAVHIRRGDVGSRDRMRFTHNKRYIEIITFIRDKYPDKKISIFSEGREDDFIQKIIPSNEKNFELYLNSDMWFSYHCLVSAEVLVTAKSCFSYTAALLNQNTIYYIPFHHKPLKHWNLLNF